MSRRAPGLLIAGWLLGLLTAFAWPAVSAEHRTRVVDKWEAVDAARGATGNGWILNSTSTIGDGVILQLERPRYRAIGEQLFGWFDSLGNYAQRLRYAVRSNHCGSGGPASSVEVTTTPEPPRNGGGNRYAVAWTVKNDCDAPIVVNLATIAASRLDNSPLFAFSTSEWVWIEAGTTGHGQTSSPGYWSAEHPARIDVQLRYGYTR
jgi:hypothetical protein